MAKPMPPWLASLFHDNRLSVGQVKRYLLERGLPIRPVGIDERATMSEATLDPNGLVPAVLQHETTGEVLMVAWMNAEALRLTALPPVKPTFGAAAAAAFGTKGGDFWKRNAACARYWSDCDGDTLLMRVDRQAGFAIRRATCFFQELGVNMLYEANGIIGRPETQSTAGLLHKPAILL